MGLKEVTSGFIGVCGSVIKGRTSDRKRAMFFVPLVCGILFSLVMGWVCTAFLTFAVAVFMELGYVFLSERRYCLTVFCLTLPNLGLLYRMGLKEAVNVVRGRYDVTDAYYSYSALFIVLAIKCIFSIF